MAGSPEMYAFAARLVTFQHAHQLAKRRASSTSSKKKGGNTVEWPHEQPAVEELARAGFFYRPAPDSLDNVQCFLCAVKLDGWEASDSPLAEHISHAPSCAWALSLSVSRPEDSTDEEEGRDPMSDVLVAARTGTFAVGEGWVHEGKRGWRCKISKMVEAGWTFDPSPETEDGVTCMYCALSLDGWEPKDDPYAEHRRRSPECAFFALSEKFHGAGKGKGKGEKGGKGRGGASTASKGSRLSRQSAVSVAVSEAPSAAENGESGVAVDDSVVSTAITASQATVKGGKKKGRPAKASKGRERANTVDEPEEVAPEVQYPELNLSRQSQAPGAFPESSLLTPEEEEPAPAPPARATRKGTRQSKQVDSSILDASQFDAAPKKAIRGRKAQAQPEPEPEPDQRLSEVSAQLQEELEHSMDYDDAPDNESTPQQALVAKAKRGVKRTSDGVKKEQDSSIVMGLEFPAPPQPAPKAKRGRKPSRQQAVAQEAVHVLPDEQESANWEVYPANPEPAATIPGPETPPEPPVKKAASKAKKAPTKKGKGRKASSTRSSRATVTDREAEAGDEREEDLARDEAEIEAELERMAGEQAALALRRVEAVGREQERGKEFEGSPSQTESHGQAETSVMPELNDDVANQAVVVQEAQPCSLATKQAATPSPNGSDKENQPSSILQPAAALKAAAPAPLLSPTKTTTRIPLAPGTPNRRPLSPSKPLSPTKHPLHLSTTTPWQPIDLDTIFLTSPAHTPGTLATRLVEASGGLTSPEMGMSVEEWVRWMGERGEEELRRRCEELVGVFEREGGRGMEVLGGIEVLS